jgi:pimeloyl-ACP methyl ester carboxylesterase
MWMLPLVRPTPQVRNRTGVDGPGSIEYHCPALMSPNPRTGFVECDAGLRLWWQSVGSGPTLICCNGVGVSTFFWKYVVEHFSPHYQVVLWDYRGHGQSEQPTDLDSVELSIEASARDLGLVAEAVGAKNAVLLGHSMGCQVALERYHQAPDSVSGLALLFGSAGRVLETFFDRSSSVKIHQAVMAAADRLGPRANKIMRALTRSPVAWSVTRRLRMVDPDYTRREDFQPYLDHLGVIDSRLFLHMVQEANRHDAFSWLSEVAAPTLIIAGENDKFTPLHVSERMVSELPRGEIMVLADGTHAAIIEQPETINHRLGRFLSEISF